jgi:hypothetical protein
LNNFIAYLFDDYRKQKNARLFKNLLYVFLIVKCVFWLLNFDKLFGENSISLTSDHKISFFKNFAYFLYFQNNPAYCMYFIAVLLIACLYTFNSKRSFLVIDLVIYLLVLNIDIRIFTTSTAGESLLVNVCFLSAWLKKDFKIGTGTYDQIKIVLHNVSFYALLFQICIVYGYSALAKWYDADWLSGNAVYLTSKTFHYSRGFIVDHVDSVKFLAMALTYIVLLYQSLFPVLVWFKKIKPYILIIGVLMHLYIAFVMGFFFFGVIMILTYVLFFDFVEEEKEEQENQKINKPV